VTTPTRRNRTARQGGAPLSPFTGRGPRHAWCGHRRPVPVPRSPTLGRRRARSGRHPAGWAREKPQRPHVGGRGQADRRLPSRGHGVGRAFRLARRRARGEVSRGRARPPRPRGFLSDRRA
jgi:hypothetical protein